MRGCTVRNLSGYALNKGISERSSSLRSTPILAFTEKRPSPIVSHPTASIFSRTSGVRRSPLPRPLLRTIGYGQPQLRSAVSNPAPFTRSRQARSADGSLPMNCGVTRIDADRGTSAAPPFSSLSRSGSTPAFAAMKGVTVSENPAARISSAKTSRKHRIVTPLRGARIIPLVSSSSTRTCPSLCATDLSTCPVSPCRGSCSRCRTSSTSSPRACSP